MKDGYFLSGAEARRKICAEMGKIYRIVRDEGARGETEAAMPPGSEADISLSLARRAASFEKAEPSETDVSTDTDGQKQPDCGRPESDVPAPTKDWAAGMSRRSTVGETNRPLRKRNRKNAGEGRHSLRAPSRPWTRGGIA